ncbi:MAG TPA: hypothetical protein HA282_01265 [Nanoarchaeota archaeon]|nr:hypothetical protein [Candidatus Pacearchaeota archaeon]HIH17981.1 hypothetical protein [Nanoarchaeota archaeon]HIH33849.1 hypothetical protein [Nanoarchaeota archaeon]HIH50792.1 hypothetical protein [Nanoarchaeota archaeon]HIH65828.1 hypothetical protein [Nanoarchaeota archaeon]
MKSKIAQASLEFLMTYGWVIFVVLGIIAAFSFIGVLKPETFVTERCLLAPPLFCEDTHFNALTGDVTLRVRNSLREGINVNELGLSGEESCYILLPNPDERNIVSDGQRDFVLDCDFDPNTNVKSALELHYAEDGAPEGLDKVSRGEVFGKVS